MSQCHHKGWLKYNRETKQLTCEDCGEVVPDWKVNNC